MNIHHPVRFFRAFRGYWSELHDQPIARHPFRRFAHSFVMASGICKPLLKIRIWRG